jgi:hypothetical protein
MAAREVLTLRFPPDLLARAREVKDTRESLNEFVIHAVDQEVRRRSGARAFDEILRVREAVAACVGLQPDSGSLIRRLREGGERGE